MSESYISLFLNSALVKGSPWGPLSLLLLFFARFMPIVALAPFFGAKVMPHPVKVVFTLTMFIVFLPQLLIVTTSAITFDVNLTLYILKELFIGFVMGYMISIPFMIVQNAGIFIDHQRGGASLMVNDPTIQNQSSPLGTLFNLILIFVFFTLDGPFLFIEAIINSYELIPPDKFINPQFFAKDSSFWTIQMELLNQVMVISIRLCSPALLAILMTDVFLGIANRLAPQVQITFLGMPLKSLLALAVVFLGWFLFLGEMGRVTFNWINSLNDMMKLFRPGTPTIPLTPI